MRTLRLPDDVDAREREAWTTLRRTSAGPEHYDEIIEPPCRIEYPDGRLAALYDVVTTMDDDLRAVLPTIPPASGVRTGGMPTRSRQVGARPRYPLRQREYCGRCTFDAEFPGVYDRLVTLGAELASWYHEAVPALHDRQVGWIEETLRPEYRMTGPFTSGILNFDNALPYHRDAGNIADSWNAMVVIREDTEGGYLVIPAWRVAFAAGDRHALLLDAQATTHGVTRIDKIRRTGWRVSMVYYCLKALALCGSPEEEAAHARRMRTIREERRAGLA